MANRVTRLDISTALGAVLLVVAGLYFSALDVGIGRTASDGSNDYFAGGLLVLVGGMVLGSLIENVRNRNK